VATHAPFLADEFRKRIDLDYPLFLHFPNLLLWTGYAYFLGSTLFRGGPGLAVASNPGFPHGKTEILDRIGREFGDFLPRYCRYPISVARPPHIAPVKELLDRTGIGFPLVAKPEKGLQGLMVRRLGDREEMEEYLTLFAQRFPGRDLHFQDIVEEPGECTAFYIRDPDEETGRVVALTLRQAPCVVGDGHATLRDLIGRSRRPRAVLRFLLEKNRARLDTVPAAGAIVDLGFTRNQSRGAMLEDVTSRLTESFSRQIDAISRSMGPFHYGRYDIKYRSLDDALHRNRFKILEVNGALATDSRLYAENLRLSQALGRGIGSLRHLRRIAIKNARRGVPYPSTLQYARELRGLAKSIRALNEGS
jgi:hypothetical protein